jgi:predicted PurR-regulated permease PerM
VVVFVPLTFFGITIFHEAQGLYGTVASGGGEFFAAGARRLLADQPWLRGIVADLSANLAAYASRALDVILQNLGPIVSSIGQAFFMFLLTLIALYYLFKDGHRLEEAFVGISPLPEASSRKILGRLHATATSVVRGSLIIVVLQGLIVGLGFLIFGVPNAAVWGLLTVFAALVPVVGVLVTVVPAAAYLALTSGALSAVGFFLWSYVVAGAAENFLKPRLIKRGAGVHPFLILISILGGISVFGAIGFLMGPLVLSLLFALLDLHATVARGDAAP